MITTATSSTVRCPIATCDGHLQQGEYDGRPRCDRCLREYDLLEADDERAASPTERQELQDKLDEIASIARY